MVLPDELLLLADGHCLTEQVMFACHPEGADDHDDLRASSLETLTQLVGAAVAARRRLRARAVRSQPLSRAASPCGRRRRRFRHPGDAWQDGLAKPGGWPRAVHRRYHRVLEWLRPSAGH